MADRSRQPTNADGARTRPVEETLDGIAWFNARRDMEAFALQSRAGVQGDGGAGTRPQPANNPNNLINDSDFGGAALDPGWSTSAGAISIVTAFDGSLALGITGPSTTVSYGFPSSTAIMPCGAGDSIYFGCYMHHADSTRALCQIGVSFYSSDGTTLISTVSVPIDSITSALNWSPFAIAAAAPYGAAFYRPYIFFSAAGATVMQVSLPQVVLTNDWLGPVNTSPSQQGTRSTLEGARLRQYTDHHLETIAAQLQADIANGAAAVKDRGTVSLTPPTMSGASAGGIQLYGRSADGTAQSQAFVSSDEMDVLGKLAVTGTSAFGAAVSVTAGGLLVVGGTATDTVHATGASALDGLITGLAGLDLTGTAILRGALNLLGGMNASSFVLDVYQPVDINPILTAAGGTANCGAQHTAFTITDRKMAILVLHFVSCATINNTATSIQHVQAGVLTNTAGAAPATAQTFSIPGSCIGTSNDRVNLVCGYINTGVTCSGAFNVLPRLQWTTTATVGAGGVANLQSFSSTTITIAMAVA